MDAKTLEIAGAAGRLCGYVVLCKKHNEDDWMHGLASHMNSVLRAIGSSDRVFYSNMGTIAFREKESLQDGK